MSPRVTVLDYQAGNLRSAQRALERAGATVRVTDDAREADASDLLVIPGVGRFGQCVRRFSEAGFTDLVKAWIADDRPVFGICIGMQILYAHSEEDPEVEGLGILPGVVRRLPPEVTVPHMGWDTVVARDTGGGVDPLLEGVDGELCYFANSYYADPADDAHVLATCPYGPGFPCVVRTGSVVGTQFHPEKSGDVGARLLSNLIKEHV